MNLCIDQGNSSCKIGIYDNNNCVKNKVYNTLKVQDIIDLLEQYEIKSCILSSVISDSSEIISLLNKKVETFIELTHSTSLPINNLYETPETLGKDRLAAVNGAHYLLPNKDLLIIDAGTAITFDFIDAGGNYQGGNIAPGIEMRLRAMHEYTKKLPLESAEIDTPFLGKNTQTALRAGALYGIVFEIDGYINTLKIKYPQLSTYLTGGSHFYFDNKLKNAIFAEKNLVLIGLNRILQYNVQK